MLLAKVCRASISPQVTSLLKTPVVPRATKFQVTRLYASDGRTFARSGRIRAKIIEDVTKVPGETAFNVGKGFAAGGAVLGLGALCYYGAGLSSATGAIDHAKFWPEYVKDRVHTTYMYFGGSIAASAATAAACLRSPAVMRMVTQGGWVAMGVSLVAMIGSGMLVRSIPYQEGFGAKQMAWLVHSGVIGAVIAPLSLLGGPIMLRAAMYTAGIVGGLSAVAVCAPSDKFLNMGGPLAIGLGVVFASSIGSMFLPPTTAVGAGLHSMVLYGGLVLFSMFLLYDTQRIIKQAETHPVPYRQFANSVGVYDPVNNAISIYLDTINIFVRIVSILSGGGSRRK
ncbi:growth hormone-inducible transmembrane protein-like [Chelonus insularis]|uniref:growth hormone-inducible transmembrane protein-like n=1 Tax=Chelonus insularis TaxID=460826 RepID=UPI00158D5376|nr:growth hormone-inducible transmembrane protein-like [Chelonus insularis]